MTVLESFRGPVAVDELKTVQTHEFVLVLDEEMRRSSGAETTRSADWAARWAFDDDGTLVGRAADLDRIGAFIADVPRAGGPLLLMGEPGAGKTALLAASGCLAEASGMRVLRTAGVEYRARVRYSGLQQLVKVVAEHQPSIVAGRALAAVLGHADGPAPGCESVAGDVLSLVRRLSRSKPVLLAVDDVQWLDPASAVVLGLVARRLDGTGAGLLGTARPGAEGPFDCSDLPVYDVGPLSDRASEELLIRRFPELAPRVRRRVMAQAQGNPLALAELPVPLSDSQRAAAQPLPERFPLTRRLRSALASRIAGLPAATRYLLLLAALDGTGDLRVLRRSAAGRCSLKHLGPGRARPADLRRRPVHGEVRASADPAGGGGPGDQRPAPQRPSRPGTGVGARPRAPRLAPGLRRRRA
jgi:hypothetical protein